MANWFKKNADDSDKDNTISTVTIDKEKFYAMLNFTFCVASTSTVENLRGALLKITGNKLTLVSTDGRRLAVAEGELISSNIQEKNIFLPLETISKIRQNTSYSYSKISLTIRNKEIAFNSGLTYEVKDDKQFPKYEQVMPPVSKNKLDINRDNFLWALNNLRSLKNNENPAIKLQFSVNNLIISIPGSQHQHILSLNYQGPAFNIGFNINYLIDALENLPSKSDTICLEFNGPEQPGVIRGKDYTYVVLPMRLK